MPRLLMPVGVLSLMYTRHSQGPSLAFVGFDINLSGSDPEGWAVCVAAGAVALFLSRSVITL